MPPLSMPALSPNPSAEASVEGTFSSSCPIRKEKSSCVAPGCLITASTAQHHEARMPVIAQAFRPLLDRTASEPVV
jgi:hypothetical protein